MNLIDKFFFTYMFYLSFKYNIDYYYIQNKNFYKIFIFNMLIILKIFLINII